MDLSTLDGYFRDLFLSIALRPINTLRDNPEKWCSLSLALQHKAQKAFTIISDLKISHLVESFVYDQQQNRRTPRYLELVHQPLLRRELIDHILYVLLL